MCATLQYLELFQSGTVQCAFEEGYLGIQWYDSTTIGTPPIITFVKSVKGGSGYLSREYDVYPNGSLIINNVTLHHERIFSVSVAASEDEPIKDWYIQVKSKGNIIPNHSTLHVSALCMVCNNWNYQKK